jgi:tRNA pseudouridine13 synthase
MKLKSRPEDFVVVELSDLKPTNGNVALYRLEKTGLGTLEAAQLIARQWNLARDAVRHGGLKDRHATTTQFVTIHNGPKQNLKDRSFDLIYLGQTPHHFHARDISGNRFEITLRRLSTEAVDEIRPKLAALQQGGLVNYFDDQRFGSLGVSGDWIAQAWCQGDYEKALYLSIAEANVHDRPREKEQKALLRDFWGRWPECKEQLDRSHRRSIVTFLADHPTNFRKAIALLRPDLRSLYVAAFQSFLWNRWLSDLMDRHFAPTHVAKIESLCGPLLTPNQQATQDELAWLKDLELPLPSARQKTWPESTHEVLAQILEPWQMTTQQLRLKFPRDTFFRNFEAAFENDSKPTEAPSAVEEPVQPRPPERFRLHLKFELPRGAYATMIVKHLSIDENP